MMSLIMKFLTITQDFNLTPKKARHVLDVAYWEATPQVEIDALVVKFFLCKNKVWTLVPHPRDF